jgi:CO/xanthine dehydrogenase FAD-binding subunit
VLLPIAPTPSVLCPRTLDEALAIRADTAATPIAGGTAVLVEMNAGHEPDALLDLSRVAELRTSEIGRERVRLGAAVTYSEIMDRFARPLPGLAAAARTIAGRQVRNRATLGGALALGDPSSDILAALVAAEASVEVCSRGRGTRQLPADEFVLAPGATALSADELIVGFDVPITDGPVEYAKVGARNAMARAVCGVALALHATARTATVAVVGAGPRAVRARAAEELIAAEAPWGDLQPLDPAWVDEVATEVAAAVPGFADQRGSAAYRRHLAGILGRRTLLRAWSRLGQGA